MAYIQPGLFSTVQYLQSGFMLVFAVLYRLVASALPRTSLSPLEAQGLLRKARLLIIPGLLPIAAEVVTRLVASGSLRPTAEYGDIWFKQHDDVMSAGASGGLQYLLVQLYFKASSLAIISLGMGLGLLFADCFLSRRWLRLAALHLVFPVMTYLGPGARSYVAVVFIMAIVVADLLARQLPWRYVFATALAGIAFFNFYGSFRRYQSAELGEAIALAQQSASDEEDDVATGEGPAMLVKEAYIVSWVAATHTEEGLGSYFLKAVLWVVPSQVLPEKATWTTTADFLSQELLGSDADRGAGVAGAMVGTGYVVHGVAGVLVLAAVLGAIGGAVVRLLVGPAALASGERIWRVGLLASFGSQTFWFIRGDLQSVLSMIVYGVCLPAILIAFARRLAPKDELLRPLQAAARRRAAAPEPALKLGSA